LFDDILPAFSAIAEIKSLRRFATNMLHTYAGREPGELILKGQIRRGDIRTITAAEQERPLSFVTHGKGK
jgi:adenylate cyclase